VLAHAAEGMSNRGIAQLLGIGERTVENHVTRIFHKLKLPDGNQRVLAILELQKAEGRRPPRPSRS
jgi:DNA-binding NarL/FixJ family response regulator